MPLLALMILSVLNLSAQKMDLPSGVYDLDSTQKNGWVNKKIEGSTTGLSVLNFHVSTLSPGKINHPPRALTERDELIVVKDGMLTVNLNDSAKTLGPGSIALIIAGDQQSFANNGTEAVTYFVIGLTSKAGADLERGKHSGGSLLRDWNELAVKKTAKGESRSVFDRPSAVFPRFEVHATLLNAGEISHPVHTHRAEEIMLMMQGNVTMHISNDSLMAKTGSLILLRPDIPHNLINTGTTPCWYYAIKWYTSTD